MAHNGPENGAAKLLPWPPAGVHDLAAGVWVKRRRRCMSIANAITNRMPMNPVGVPYHVGVLPFAIEMAPAGARVVATLCRAAIAMAPRRGSGCRSYCLFCY